MVRKPRIPLSTDPFYESSGEADSKSEYVENDATSSGEERELDSHSFGAIKNDPSHGSSKSVSSVSQNSANFTDLSSQDPESENISFINKFRAQRNSYISQENLSGTGIGENLETKTVSGKENISDTDSKSLRVEVKKRKKVVIPRTNFNGSIIIFTTVVIVIISLFVSPINQYLQQQKLLDKAQQELQIKQKNLAELQDYLAKWEDPSFVEQYVRQNLFYIREGEISYMTVGIPAPGNILSGDLEDLNREIQNAGSEEQDLWYQNLWNSFN